MGFSKEFGRSRGTVYFFTSYFLLISNLTILGPQTLYISSLGHSIDLNSSLAFGNWSEQTCLFRFFRYFEH